MSVDRKYEDLILKDSRDNLKRLIASTLLDYEHHFIRSLHVVGSKPRIREIN